MSKTNIVIVEDHAMFREGINSLLGTNRTFNIVGEYSNGEDFLNALHLLSCDIVLMDIEMPGMTGIEATRRAIEINPNIKVIALTMYGSQQYYYEMISAGVKGFVNKELSVNVLEHAIQKVNEGEHFFSTDMMRNVIMKMGRKSTKELSRQSSLSVFSDRELDVLKLLCQGLTNNQISEKLFLSPKTIESHKTKMIKKTGQHNSAGLIVYAIRNKVIEL